LQPAILTTLSSYCKLLKVLKVPFYDDYLLGRDRSCRPLVRCVLFKCVTGQLTPGSALSFRTHGYTPNLVIVDSNPVRQLSCWPSIRLTSAFKRHYLDKKFSIEYMKKNCFFFVYHVLMLNRHGHGDAQTWGWRASVWLFEVVDAGIRPLKARDSCPSYYPRSQR
jgi:hypothetical protein